MFKNSDPIEVTPRSDLLPSQRMRLVSVSEIPLNQRHPFIPLSQPERWHQLQLLLIPFSQTQRTHGTELNTILDWFSKIVTTGYGYSDIVIKHRQEGVNKKYKIEKAEKEGLRIMKEQENKKKAVTKNLGKREWSESAAEEDDYDLDWLLEYMDEF